ncbi:MAG: hypothetical protein JWN50_100 [Parcubacteria group bacterium]|nr:hypothetical protein [Parcubacteria group bacterium]
METPTPDTKKKKKVLYYSLWPVYFLAAFILNSTGDWWTKLLD